MIEMSTNPSVQIAIRRAHEERSRFVHKVLGWVFGSR